VHPGHQLTGPKYEEEEEDSHNKENDVCHFVWFGFIVGKCVERKIMQTAKLVVFIVLDDAYCL
jgi:hypothetical protein